MRKLFATALLVTAVFCSSAISEAGTVIERIQKRGELVVGTSANQPPLTMRSKNGGLMGFDIDLAGHIASSMGVRLRIVQMPFAQLLPSLESGDADMVLSGVTVTAERNMKVAFIGPYYVSGKGVLAKLDTISTMKDIKDFNDRDYAVAALRDSTSEKFVRESLPDAKLVSVDHINDAVNMLVEGKIDALIADFPTCLVTAVQKQDSGLAAGQAPFTYEPLGIAVPAGDPLLVNLLENVLSSLTGSGALKKMINTWFEDPSWMERME